MTKAITNFSFLVATTIVVLIFFSSRTYTQLAFSTVLYAALVYIGLMIFPRKAKTTTSKIGMNETQIAPTSVQSENITVFDIDRRTFLKLVGATSLSFFVFSILGRTVESLLFSKNPMGPFAPQGTGQGIANASSPTEGYRVSEIDEGEISFFGFTNQTGGWLIMKEDINSNSFRYAKGEKNFPKNWVERENLIYDYYHNLI